MSKTAKEVIADFEIVGDDFALMGETQTIRLLAALDAAGFVIVPNNDIRPYPLLLDEELLIGLVLHLTAGTADLSIVRNQLASMQSAAATEKSTDDRAAGEQTRLSREESNLISLPTQVREP